MDLDRKIDLLERKIEEFRIRLKDSEERKVWESCLDDFVLRTLYKFADRGIIKRYGGVVSVGKEANVFHAIGSNDEELAIKIYRITASNFRAMSDYIIGDPRFSNVRREKRAIILAWTKKEMKNLSKAYEAGVPVPKPVTFENNVLVMEFLGCDGVAAPRMKDVENLLHEDEAERIFKLVVDGMRDLYHKAKLVHSDLSEYNILYFDSKPYFIDMGAGVTLSHPSARDFLMRDLRNVARFFSKLGVECDERSIAEAIGVDIR